MLFNPYELPDFAFDPKDWRILPMVYLSLIVISQL